MSRRRRPSKLKVAVVCGASAVSVIAGALTLPACSLKESSSPVGSAEQGYTRKYDPQPKYEEPETVSTSSDIPPPPPMEMAQVQTRDVRRESLKPVDKKAEAKPMPEPKQTTPMLGGLGSIGMGSGGNGLAMGHGKSGGGSAVVDGLIGEKDAKQNGPMKKPAKVAANIPVTGSSSVGYVGDEGGEVDGNTGVNGSGNSYDSYRPNPWTPTAEDRFSTFAADVDTASYTQTRRFLNSSTLPPTASVRVEEYVNYFNYQYAPPKEGAFAVHLEGAPSPFTAGRHLLKIGVKGKVISKSERKPAHLVFLVDTSGSMSSDDKLPLAQQTLKVLVNNLNENDTVSLVTYAGSVRDVLPPTSANDRQKIIEAIDSLQSGGGTAMGSGMELAYAHAVKDVSSRSVSRVIVLTDGDTNIGKNQTANDMLASIKNHVAEGVTLTMVGFGMGNYRDSLMEKLADAGNGNCYYVDSVKEAKRVFQEKLSGTLEVIAKDVKLQVEFNPEAVTSYRLVGYENRDIADKDFRNDKVDAGEIGAGHTVTALYEVQLSGGSPENIATVRVRAKEPSGSEAKEQAFAFGRDRIKESIDEASADFRFATAVAGTADILRGNPQTEGWSLAVAEKLAKGSAGDNPDRQEFVQLVQKARQLMGDVAVAKR